MLEKVGALAYRVALSLKLGKIHNVFHVSLLRKYVYDTSHVVEIEPIQLNENLAYEEYPIRIVDTMDNVTPLSGPTRLADLNRFRDSRLILFVYFSFVCLFVFVFL